MQLSECNPFIRAAMIQPAVLEGASPRMAYDYRIFLILGGEGKGILGEDEIPLSENSFLCIPPETEYYFRGKMKVAVLNFDVTRKYQERKKPLMPVPRAEYDNALRFDPTRAEGYERSVFFTADLPLRESVLEIVNTYGASAPYSDARCSAELKKLLAYSLAKQTEHIDPRSRLAERILLYIRSNAAEITDNEAIGKALGYHPIYLSSLIKEKTGKSLHQTVLEERIRLACRFLLSTENSIEQISFDTGFSSRNHFCTVFRKMLGTSPLAYRKTHEKGNKAEISESYR